LVFVIETIQGGLMKVLLYNPDNGVTRNFMPHLWMFLLQALTPPEHEVLLIDGNAKAMDEEELVQFVKQEGIGLVGIGAMTRMIAKAYRVADALRGAGVKVVMGGPHVTELPQEALEHADAVALGEADELWATIISDVEQGKLKNIYAPLDEKGRDKKPSLDNYPKIPWETLELEQFNAVPTFLRSTIRHLFPEWGSFRIIPIESGRGCPYGCEFCTVTGFFGDSIRFRTNESIVDEILRLKARAKSEGGQVAVFFVDDNFAINKKRTKSLLRDMITAGATLTWIAQISANLLRDEELVDLISESGGRIIFIGMESIDTVNLADVNKSFNKPDEYAEVLARLADRDIYAITSFIFGMDNDTKGVSDRTLNAIKSWPPGWPVFGQLTPFPATPLYNRLAAAGRLTRPTHWLDFAPYQMAHTPLKLTIPEAQAELENAWANSYSPERNAEALESIRHKGLGWRVFHFLMRMGFRGIYFPQMNGRAWAKVIWQNRKTILNLAREGIGLWRTKRKQKQLEARTTEA
jgi:radical SAM superfamily enzyme YgiQ (UPF0313 family)